MLTLFEALVCSAVAAYLSWTLIRLRHRNAESWESLLGRLRMDWTARELSALCRPQPEKHLGLAEKWHRVRGARGLWAMFANAGVMLEIADYAARNNSHIAPSLLQELRNDAVQIRVSVLKTMAAYAAGSVEDSICMQSLRAESGFLEMQVRMTEFLEANAPVLAPAFSAAL